MPSVDHPKLTRVVQWRAVPGFRLGPYHRDVAEPVIRLCGDGLSTSWLGWCTFSPSVTKRFDFLLFFSTSLDLSASVMMRRP